MSFVRIACAAAVASVAFGAGFSGVASAASMVPAPASSTAEIGARIRWGASGFEASVYDNNPFGQTPTLNPSGSPVWQVGQPYGFAVSFDSLTGSLGLSVDFNRDQMFGSNESIARTSFAAPGETDYTGLGFSYLSISGNESGNAGRASLTDLVINGVAQSSIAANGGFTEVFFASALGAPASSWDITGNITFSVAGTSQERPSYNFLFRDSAAIAPVPLPAAAWMLLAGMAALGAAARRRARA